MVLSYVMLAAVAQATAPAAAPDAPQRDIVVTGKRLSDLQATLDACRARNCPPDEEAKAALAVAETNFVGGDYRASRRALLDTIGRIDKRAKEYPVAVADVWRAEARISAHLGEEGAMRIGQIESIDALKSGLAKGDSQILIQRIEIGDTFAKQGKLDIARTRYVDVAREAEKLGQQQVRGIAMLRLAIFDSTLARVDYAQFGETSRKSIAAILKTTEPELAPFREAATLIRARLQAHRGDLSGIDQLVASYASKRSSQPMLLFAPIRKDAGTIFDINQPRQFADGYYDDQWADVSFLIGADGTVRDIEVLRESKSFRPDWLVPVTATIAGRRYAPLDVPPGLDGLRRVERYTLTAFKSATTGSRMDVRGLPRVEMLDLTAEPTTASAGATAPPS